MPDSRRIVINTGPLIALVAGLGDLEILRVLYGRVVVPREVEEEILNRSATRFGAPEYCRAGWLEKRSSPVALAPYLQGLLDRGEASVIQVALDESIPAVALDEEAGRRVARLCGLKVTGSLGILLRARREGHVASVADAISRMRRHGIWISDALAASVLQEAGESAEPR